MKWNVYLSGEIHTNWRDEIKEKSIKINLPINFFEPITDHNLSDDCGIKILGKENKKFWHDQKSANLNAIRTSTLIKKADIIIVKFGNQYKQWNVAYDAGFAVALSKPLIIFHNDENQHALKEIDASAHAVVKNVNQIISILKYTIKGKI